MFVQICRYRILPATVDRYLSIQEQASRVYQLHGLQPAIHLQSHSDPQTWIEVHRFADEPSCRAATQRINADPQVLALWEAFKATLDPAVPPQIEEFDERGALVQQPQPGNRQPESPQTENSQPDSPQPESHGHTNGESKPVEPPETISGVYRYDIG